MDLLGLNWDKLHQELSADLSGIVDKVRGTGGDPLARVQTTGMNSDPLARVNIGGASSDPLGRVNLGSASSDPLGRVRLGSGTPFAFLPQSSHDDPFWRLPASMGVAGADRTATPTSSTYAGSTAASGGQYGTHEAYRAAIVKYAQANGIDPDALAAILQVESPTGDPKVTSYAGARGLGQVMPDTWNAMVQQGTLSATDDPYSADGSIKAAAAYYAEQYRRFGDYGLAAAAYNGGPGAIVNGRARDYGGDGYTTPKTYADLWEKNYQRIKATAPRSAGIPGTMASIWGNANAPVTQDLGAVTPGIDQGIYTYGAQYGLPQGHTGLDIGVRRGTQLYAPMAGTVQIAGGSGVFRDEDYGDAGNVPGKGELRILLDDGTVLILGHTSAISVKVGQRINAGQAVALSGSASGDHLHLEVRVPDKSQPGGYRIVDPRQYFAAQNANTTAPSASGLR